ncbi:MAG: hypothetical protein ABI947_14390 [Chloroflexota bacterium]
MGRGLSELRKGILIFVYEYRLTLAAPIEVTHLVLFAAIVSALSAACGALVYRERMAIGLLAWAAFGMLTVLSVAACEVWGIRP